MNTPCTGGNLMHPPPHRRCNAKTRAGTACRNWGRFPSGRCRMHGGRSFGGIASPTFIHGDFSRWEPHASLARGRKLHAAWLKRVERRIAEERTRWAAEDRARQRRQAAPAFDDNELATLLELLTDQDADPLDGIVL